MINVFYDCGGAVFSGLYGVHDFFAAIDAIAACEYAGNAGEANDIGVGELTRGFDHHVYVEGYRLARIYRIATAAGVGFPELHEMTYEGADFVMVSQNLFWRRQPDYLTAI